MKRTKSPKEPSAPFRCPWCLKTLQSRDGAQSHFEGHLDAEAWEDDSDPIKSFFAGVMGTLFDGPPPRHTQPIPKAPAPDPKNIATYKEILREGYRSLAKKYHPDAGGSDEQMKQLNGVMENLKAQGVL